MTQETIENILTIYDQAKNKGKSMNQICGLFHIHRDELKKMLKENGRKLPSGRLNPSPDEDKKDPIEAAAAVPEYVREVLDEKVEDLSTEIAHLEENIAKMESEKTKLNARIMEIHSFFNQFL